MFDAELDTADIYNTLIGSFEGDAQDAIRLACDLPGGWPIGMVTTPDGHCVCRITAGVARDWLIAGTVEPQLVIDLIRTTGAVRPPVDEVTLADELAAMDPDIKLCAIGGDCVDEECGWDECDHDRPTVGWMTAGKLLDDLNAGVASPVTARKILAFHRGDGDSQ